MFERKHQPLAAHEKFVQRMAKHALIALGAVALSLAIGMIGYMTLENLNTIDAFLNATMLLGGMGPVNMPQTNAGKIFAGIYALYSGIVFLLVVGVLFTPIYHRFLHHFHLEMDDDENV